MIENGFELTVTRTKNYAMRIWKGEKWDAQQGIPNDTRATQFYVVDLDLFSKMKLIKKVLRKSRRDDKLPKNMTYGEFEFEHLWTIVLFTSDKQFCNEYQKDLRKEVGCKWRCMEVLLCESIDTVIYSCNCAHNSNSSTCMGSFTLGFNV